LSRKNDTFVMFKDGGLNWFDTSSTGDMKDKTILVKDYGN